MTKSEFSKWRNMHIALFPGLMPYISRAFGDNASLAELMWNEWFRVLAKVALEDAIQASRILAASEEEVKPEKHPYRIVQIAKSLKIGRYDWDALKDESECEMCGGTGAVVIKKGNYRSATRCSCPLGKRLYPFLREYNPEIDEAE